MRRFDAAATARACRPCARLCSPCCRRFDYATLTLNGRDNAVVILRGYAATPIDDSVLDTLDHLFDLTDAGRTMRYVDARAASKRRHWSKRASCKASACRVKRPRTSG